MRWPWVSRALLDEVRAQLAASETERAALLERLLAPVPVAAPEVEDKPQSEPQPFTTPIDKKLFQFDQAFPRGTAIPSRFRARTR